jgi:hypothetical protein
MTFTFTSDGKCPNCGYQHFTSASNPTEDAPITCLRCKGVTTVKKAMSTFTEAEWSGKAEKS